MKISFCTTCMGRLHHLRESLPKNLADNAEHDDLEFVILDYNSQDGLEEWAREALRPHIASGRAVYYRERTVTQFVMPHAKNVAHGLATGDVLYNLDADSFTGPGFAGLLSETFRREGPRIITTHPEPVHAGRLAVTRESFRALRGYDEDFIYGWGYEDVDFAKRAVQWGLRAIPLSQTGPPGIPHSNGERLRFTAEKHSLQVSKGIHKFYSQERLSQGILVRNEGRPAGSAVVYRNFGEEPIQAGW